MHTGSRWYTTSVNVPQGLQCILFIPEQRQETEACRAILVRGAWLHVRHTRGQGRCGCTRIGLHPIVAVPVTLPPPPAAQPPTIPRGDAVYNIGRASLLVNAFASGNLDDLALATQDA